MGKIDFTKYPICWPRASLLIRQLADGHCERCGLACNNLSVHHQGAPFANGKPGNSRDKHDLRRENLIALCFSCHDELDHIRIVRKKYKQRKAKRAAKREAHQALGIGTGLIATQDAPSTIVSFMVILRAVHFHMNAQRRTIVDSTLIYIS